MIRLILLVTCQSIFLVLSQVFLKLAMNKVQEVAFSWSFFVQMLKNYQFALSGVSIAIASVLWMYILKKFEFSIAYPLISISYIIGLLAAVYIFNENVPLTRWIGVFVIMFGVYLIMKK